MNYWEYVRAHQHASGALHGEECAIGKFRGGPTTKLHMLADAHGHPVNFEITGGDVHDVKVTDSLLNKIAGGTEHFIADKGYDFDRLRERIRMAGAINRRRANPQLQATSFGREPVCSAKTLSQYCYSL